MKKSKEEKRRLQSKAKKRAANVKKNSMSKDQKILRKLSPEERKKMMLKELRELEAFEKATREKILTKMQTESVGSLDQQKEFLLKSLEDLDETDIKNHNTIQRVRSLVDQIDMSGNLDFLREFYKETKDDAELKELFIADSTILTEKAVEEVYQSYRTSLERDNIRYLDPAEFFTLLDSHNIPHLDQVKGWWCLYMESHSLMAVGYLITVIAKKIIIEDQDMIAEFIKFGTELV